MSPFFHGGVRPVKKYPRPWSLNPRLNPDLNKGDARMSILGLPSFETGINLPVFNGVYPKPGKDELSDVDEAVIVSSNRDSDLNDENATPEVGNVVEEERQLEPLVEEPEEPEGEALIDESTKETTPPQPPSSVPATVPVPDETGRSEAEHLPTGSPNANDLVDHDSPEEAAPEIGPTEAAQPQIGDAGLPEVTEAGNELRADEVEAYSDHPVNPAAGPTDARLEQAEEIPAEHLPSISEEPAESEGQAHDLESSELGVDSQDEVVSGPAGLGPLEVIKEEPAVSEEPVTTSSEDSAVDGANLQVEKDITDDTVNVGGLETVHEAPEIIENEAAGEETHVDSVNAHDGDATFDEQAADDATPVDERREYLGETGGEQPAVTDRKDSMFETPFETPMEKQATMTVDSTPFETPMEKPFWDPGAASQHAPEGYSLDGEDDDDDEPAEGPFIPRHSPDMATAVTGAGSAPSWGPSHDAKGFHGMEEQHQIEPSVGSASAVESATDLEPLLSDEQLDVDDEFRPGVKTQSV